MICTGEWKLACVLGQHDLIGERNELVRYGRVEPGKPVEVLEKTVEDQGRWCRHCGKVIKHGTMTGAA